MILEIRKKVPVAIILIILFLIVAGALLFFGVVNLINPDVPEEYLTRNTFVCLGLCVVGLASLLGAIAVARGSFRKK